VRMSNNIDPNQMFWRVGDCITHAIHQHDSMILLCGDFPPRVDVPLMGGIIM
jgi:hypothetical protein